MPPQDSVILQNTITNATGGFVLKDIPTGNYRVRVSYQGFAPIVKAIAPPAPADTLDLGTLLLEPVATQLPVVRVAAPSSQRLCRSCRLTFAYTTRVREPAIRQLQPGVSHFHPLNLQVGNRICGRSMPTRVSSASAGRPGLRACSWPAPSTIIYSALAIN